MATTVHTPLGARGGHLIFLAVLVGHALLLSSQVTTERGQSALRSAIVTLFSPLQRATQSGIEGGRSMWNGYVDLRGVREENIELRRRIARLEQALWLERDIVASHRRLSEVVDLAERLPYPSIVAEVIGLDASTWFRTITVNQGSNQGVELSAPVIASGGLVGRVVAVGPDVAQVQLLSDRECAVGALLTRTRIRGVVTGTGGEGGASGLQLTYVSNLDDVVSGDLIVTSGMDAMYHKGIAIGRVSSVRNGPRLFKIITVEPVANLDRLEEVFVLSPVVQKEFTKTVE